MLTGPTGCGKTSWVVQNYGHSLWWAPANFGSKALWFDGYDNEDTALFDDFNGDCDYATMLRICDGYGINAPVKGGFITFKPLRVCFTSNLEMASWWPLRGEITAFQRRVTKVISFSDNPLPVTEVAEDNTSLQPVTEEAQPWWPRDSMDIEEFLDL